MTQKLDDELLLDIENNFCRTVYQLKWLSKIQDEFNITTTTNTYTLLIHTLDHPIHPPPAKKELDSKLSRFKRSIFSIVRKHKRIPTQWVECSPMIRETWVQSQVASYQRL